MNISKNIKSAAAICVCAGGILSQAHGLTLAIEPAALLGEMSSGGLSRDKQESFINQLLSMGLNTTFSAGNVLYTRSGNQIGFLPTGDLQIQVSHRRTGILLDGTTDYLVAKYGATKTVWHVGGLAGTFNLPDFDKGHSGISTDGPVAIVPDSGSSLALLGLGMASLGLVGTCKKARGRV